MQPHKIACVNQYIPSCKKSMHMKKRFLKKQSIIFMADYKTVALFPYLQNMRHLSYFWNSTVLKLNAPIL